MISESGGPEVVAFSWTDWPPDIINTGREEPVDLQQGCHEFKGLLQQIQRANEMFSVSTKLPTSDPLLVRGARSLP